MSDLATFSGRFHLLLVHLPIGFILLAAILEGCTFFLKKKKETLHFSIKITLLATFLSSIVTIFLGFLLARGDGYDAEMLATHKWVGIGFAVFAFAAWLSRSGLIKLSPKVGTVLIFTSVTMVSFTGHFGGNLTHGSDYLTAYAPAFIKKLTGSEAANTKGKIEIPNTPDSVVVYKHLIQPILAEKCYSCHNETKTKGALLLTSTEGIQKGGDSGPTFLKGDSYKSELFIRVTLPQSEEKFMPPKGEVLTYSELKILKWWIDSGGSFEENIIDAEKSDEVVLLLKKGYNIDLIPKPYIEKNPITPIDSSVFNALKRAGWAVRTIAENVNYLDVSGNNKPMTNEMLSVLEKANEYVSWLDLSGMSLKDGHLKSIGDFKNLTKLKISNNSSITDIAIGHLNQLKNLEVLNLFNTQVTDDGLVSINNLTSLKKIFIRQTKVTAKGAESFKVGLPSLQIM